MLTSLGCRTIFVKNLPYDCDEDSVRRVMAAFGEVRDVRLACSTTGGGSSAGGSTRLKGFGYVQFASEVGTRKAAEAATNGKLVLSKYYSDVQFVSFSAFFLFFFCFRRAAILKI